MPNDLEQEIQSPFEKISADIQRIEKTVQSVAVELHRKSRPLHWWGIIAGGLGLAAAVLFGFDSCSLQRKIEKGVSATSKAIDDAAKMIDASASTRFVGRWPDHFGRITKLIGDAKASDKVIILSDFVGNWYYTMPEAYYRDYYEPLRRTDAQVEILSFDRYTAIDRIKKQFKEGNFIPQDVGYCKWAYPDDDKLPRSKWTFKTYKSYLDYYSRDAVKLITLPNDCPSTYVGLISLLLRVQDRLCNGLSNNPRIQMKTLNAKPADAKNRSQLDNYTYFYWINQNKEMVLSFRSFDDINLGSAFYTSNAEFLAEFTNQFNDKFSKAKMIVEGPYCYADAKHPLKVFKDIKGNLRYE